MTNGSPVLQAVEEVAALLRVDGATLRLLGVADSHVELAVEFDGVPCEECVLPPDQLRATVVATLSRRVGTPVTVLLHDPRAAAGVVPVAPTAGTIVVLDPTGIRPGEGAPDRGPDAGPLASKTVAIRQDVLWRSFDWTVEEWTALLHDAGATVLTWRRTQGLVGDDLARAQAEYEAVLASADLAVSGLGNCGSCTSWTVRDALTALERGIPAAAVTTAHFEPLARALAAGRGHPGLRLIVLPYPYDTLTEEEVRAHARAEFATVLDVLGATR